jgi:Rne/Rng family ribonuclease
MTKEMYVSSTPHESKVAIVEDDQLAEIFYERENEYTLAGSIYKGRVTRVLPGMQSAFVDIGLERDAFLYVSDFLDLGEEEEEEFEEIPVRPETYVTNRPQPEPRTYEFQKDFRPPEPAVNQDIPETLGEDGAEDVYTGANNADHEDNETATEENDRSYRGGRRRRRGRRGRGFPESKFTRPERESSRPEIPIAEDFRPPVGYEPIVLPGESISKYRRAGEQAGQQSGSDVTADGGDSSQVEDRPESGAEPFVIEGGFEDEDAQKQFAEPEGPVQPTVAPEALKSEPETRAVFKSVKIPFVLPGESIAKYRQAETTTKTQTQAPAETAEPVAAEEPESAIEHVVAGAENPVPELAQTPMPASTFVPAVLPGESIAKYQSHAEPTGAAPVTAEVADATPRRGEEGRRKSRQDEPRTEVRMERRSPVAPFVLPGESIAKYRRVAEPVTGEEEHARQLQEQIDNQPEEQLAQQASEMVRNNEPLSTTLERESVQEPEPVVPASEGIVETPHDDAAEALEEPTAASPEIAGEQRDEDTGEPRYAQMNVASTFGGDAVESEPEAEEDTFHPAEPQAQSAEERHGYSAQAGHTLEHEELDEEEADYVLSEEDEEGDYVEMEEQTYEPGSLQRNFGSEAKRFAEGEEIDEANGLTDALHDAIVDEETTHAAYPQDMAVDHEEIEIETPEDLAETDEEFEEAEMQSDGSMGAAGVPATRGTGYPQRGPRPYDHRQRGRRGGRRMNNRPRREPRQVPLISDLLKEGQEVLIQIAKEPIGKKGARITSHIALPGRYLVYMPTVNHIGVSRKINSEEERQRLKRIMISEREGGHGGFIVRTAAEGITEEELRADIRFLKNLWADIRQRSDNSKAPALIYHDLNLVERVLRDQVTADFSAIWVDTEQEYERILRFANRFQPQLVRKVKLYTKSTPLYEQFGIQAEIDKALKSKVWLKSGGYIVINQTEALVAIDINTGKYVGKTARLEDTIVKTNVDAIKEIVRQIRLRDLGGIIVIDFIDMDERKNRQKVMQALEEALKSDRAPSKVLQFNDFGLVAITRKRVKQSLERTLGEPCPYCTGTGLVKSLTTMCNEIYIEMRKMAAHAEREDIMLRVNPEVAKALKASGGKWIQEMEELTQKTVILKSDPLLHQEHFDIEA